MLNLSHSHQFLTSTIVFTVNYLLISGETNPGGDLLISKVSEHGLSIIYCCVANSVAYLTLT
jgi:hypothetical protein